MKNLSTPTYIVVWVIVATALMDLRKEQVPLATALVQDDDIVVLKKVRSALTHASSSMRDLQTLLEDIVHTTTPGSTESATTTLQYTEETHSTVEDHEVTQPDATTVITSAPGSTVSETTTLRYTDHSTDLEVTLPDATTVMTSEPGVNASITHFSTTETAITETSIPERTTSDDVITTETEEPTMETNGTVTTLHTTTPVVLTVASTTPVVTSPESTYELTTDKVSTSITSTTTAPSYEATTDTTTATANSNNITSTTTSTTTNLPVVTSETVAITNPSPDTSSTETSETTIFTNQSHTSLSSTQSVDTTAFVSNTTTAEIKTTETLTNVNTTVSNTNFTTAIPETMVSTTIPQNLTTASSTSTTLTSESVSSTTATPISTTGTTSVNETVISTTETHHSSTDGSATTNCTSCTGNTTSPGIVESTSSSPEAVTSASTIQNITTPKAPEISIMENAPNVTSSLTTITSQITNFTNTTAKLLINTTIPSVLVTATTTATTTTELPTSKSTNSATISMNLTTVASASPSESLATVTDAEHNATTGATVSTPSRAAITITPLPTTPGILNSTNTTMSFTSDSLSTIPTDTNQSYGRSVHPNDTFLTSAFSNTSSGPVVTTVSLVPATANDTTTVRTSASAITSKHSSAPTSSTTAIPAMTTGTTSTTTLVESNPGFNESFTTAQPTERYNNRDNSQLFEHSRRQSDSGESRPRIRRHVSSRRQMYLTKSNTLGLQATTGAMTKHTDPRSSQETSNEGKWIVADPFAKVRGHSNNIMSGLQTLHIIKRYATVKEEGDMSWWVKVNIAVDNISMIVQAIQGGAVDILHADKLEEESRNLDDLVEVGNNNKTVVPHDPEEIEKIYIKTLNTSDKVDLTLDCVKDELSEKMTKVTTMLVVIVVVAVLFVIVLVALVIALIRPSTKRCTFPVADPNKRNGWLETVYLDDGVASSTYVSFTQYDPFHNGGPTPQSIPMVETSMNGQARNQVDEFTEMAEREAGGPSELQAAQERDGNIKRMLQNGTSEGASSHRPT